MRSILEELFDGNINALWIMNEVMTGETELVHKQD